MNKKYISFYICISITKFDEMYDIIGQRRRMLLLNSTDNFVSSIINIGEILKTCILLCDIGVKIPGIRNKEFLSNRKE